MDHTDPHPNITAGSQEWAKAINAGDTYLPQEWTEAAADLITDLTENWVSIKAMQEWRRKHRGSISDSALKDFADLLPAPRTMDEIEWDDAEHHLAEATAVWVEGTASKVVMLHRNGDTIAVHQSAPHYTGLRELNPAILIPAGRKYRLEPEDDAPTSTLEDEDEGGKRSPLYATARAEIDRLNQRGGEYAPGGVLESQAAAPRPEDVPVSEAWFVEVGEREAVGYRNDPEDMICWTVVYRDEADHDWMHDGDVTLIARLVPETTEQDDEEASSNKEAMGESMADFADRIFGRFPAGEDLCAHVNRTSVEHHQERMRANEFDPAYTYLDRGGRTWGKSRGRWVQAETPDERRERRARGAGLETPPDHWGPYVRIEDTK